ncbi:MAG: hypothetical protein V3T30_06950, partial [Thermodesulfobacteriota bacterium]
MNSSTSTSKMISYRNFSIIALVTLALFLILPSCLNYLVDPFQIYHTPFFRETTFLDNQRYQNPGLINSYLDSSKGYDSIIIGSSMTENFIPSEIQKTMGWGKVLKLSIAGGSNKARKLMVLKALQTGKVKNVIWEVFWRYGAPERDEFNREYRFPKYLYNETLLDDYKYLLNH